MERSGAIMRREVGKNGGGKRMGCMVGGKGYMRVERVGSEHRTRRREDGSKAAQTLGTSVDEHISGYVYSRLPPVIPTEKYSMLNEGGKLRYVGKGLRQGRPEDRDERQRDGQDQLHNRT